MENRRLQELLHQALRREAEALRKLKHLNETLLAGGDPACGTPTSPLATDGTCIHTRGGVHVKYTPGSREGSLT